MGLRELSDVLFPGIEPRIERLQVAARTLFVDAAGSGLLAVVRTAVSRHGGFTAGIGASWLIGLSAVERYSSDYA